MIETDAQLRDFLAQIAPDHTLAIDTEFKRINTYFPVLCLLQICTKSATDCIDILAIDDLTPLFDKLYAPQTCWIAHAARQDIEALYYLSKQLPAQLFDTQIAAGFLDFPAQISYQALTQSLQNVALDKAYTRLDWTKRPIPAAAIEYALDDVRYLTKNFQLLTAQLETAQKLAWAEADTAVLLDENLYKISLENAWQKIKGLARTPQNTHLLAAQLGAWREHQAVAKNKPRKWLMSDEKLLDYASKHIKLSDKSQQNFEIFLAKNPQLSTISLNLNSPKPPTKSEKIQKNALQISIQKIARQYNLNSQILANGKEILQFIRGNQSVKFLHGWRYQLLKQELDLCKTA